MDMVASDRVRRRVAVALGLGDLGLFFEGGEQYSTFEAVYDSMATELLEKHYWSFAEEFARLAATVSAPAQISSHPYTFDLPADFLSLTFCTRSPSLYDDQSFKMRAGRKISVPENVCYLSYTRRLLAAEKLDPMFESALVLRTALELCIEIPRDIELMEKLERRYQMMDFHAIGNDYRNLDVGESIEPQSFVDARRVGSYGSAIYDERSSYCVDIPEQSLEEEL